VNVIKWHSIHETTKDDHCLSLQKNGGMVSPGLWQLAQAAGRRNRLEASFFFFFCWFVKEGKGKRGTVGGGKGGRTRLQEEEGVHVLAQVLASKHDDVFLDGDGRAVQTRMLRNRERLSTPAHLRVIVRHAGIEVSGRLLVSLLVWRSASASFCASGAALHAASRETQTGVARKAARPGGGRGGRRRTAGGGVETDLGILGSRRGDAAGARRGQGEDERMGKIVVVSLCYCCAVCAGPIKQDSWDKINRDKQRDEEMERSRDGEMKR